QQVREYWDDMELPYKKFYAYEEVLATFGDRTGAFGSRSSLLSGTERLTRRVTGDPQLALPELAENKRQVILAKYAFKRPLDLGSWSGSAGSGLASGTI